MYSWAQTQSILRSLHKSTFILWKERKYKTSNLNYWVRLLSPATISTVHSTHNTSTPPLSVWCTMSWTLNSIVRSKERTFMFSRHIYKEKLFEQCKKTQENGKGQYKFAGSTMATMAISLILPFWRYGNSCHRRHSSSKPSIWVSKEASGTQD